MYMYIRIYVYIYIHIYSSVFKILIKGGAKSNFIQINGLFF